jgi:hypothetical protein
MALTAARPDRQIARGDAAQEILVNDVGAIHETVSIPASF